MAIWPFGRKSKRHTIQLDAPAVAEVPPQNPRHSFDGSKLGSKPFRKSSKRQKNRHITPTEDCPSSLHDVLPASQSNQYPPPMSHSEQPASIRGARQLSSRLGQQHSESYTSHSNTSYDQPTLTRSGSLLKSKRSVSGPAVLKKKLSKRKAYEIAREREIRLMASAPIDIPRRPSPLPSEHFSIETRKGLRAPSRRSDRHLSDVSLPVRDSAESSLSDIFESYTFKVNTFAAWTPRPIIRYVEAPKPPTAKSQKSPETVSKKDKVPTFAASDENAHSNKKVNDLADALDAGALRELLERDRRRRERKQAEDQEKLQRKLQQAADQQQQHPLEQDTADLSTPKHQAEAKDASTTQRGRPGAGSRATPVSFDEGVTRSEDTKTFLGGTPPSGSWLRGVSNDSERQACETPESAIVIGNIDDSSIRGRRVVPRRSFAPSTEMGMSRSSLTPSHSPSRRGVYSPTSSHLYGLGRESTSDVSRTIDSDRRLSDNSSGRVNTLTSIFRRGSSRLKRSYRERFHERSPEPSNPSHESFFKVQTQSSSGPAPYVPPKAFLGTGTIKRSQSKFTEHFGDEPLSPPDSRLQSPDIPEVADEFERDDDTSDVNMVTQYPIPSSASDVPDSRNNHHASWGGESWDGNPDDVPLSQSLASIDSEGSWMSGQFLRRISQKKTSNPLRTSLSPSRNKLEEEGHEDSPKGDEVSVNEPFVRFGAEQDEPPRVGHGAGAQRGSTMTVDHTPDPAEETWHAQVARRPVLVNPAVRPKSNEGLLKTILSADEEFSPIEEHSVEFEFDTNEDYDSGRAL
ncbi:hypothetical protein ASPACDRAFT_61447 [Aspergillus aculeatus ATCC 16872]|uniref:Uncharacterized protein n=1 Tax=Aspergillus aculeatus (strain ATCC 16872 / CBS 172.66 / WB 5094) TaxID=690307 RepID=A0A1L9WRB1_ASPA1|nr:uncharacterized protein ASPACDRAFT_61447 [Aspergillus aculeatus ATCC 16872]OJJ98731.1 hypothetical protein ASPACDRAFT_61447 [Aspergillus aculeatus ATCC 16872]